MRPVTRAIATCTTAMRPVHWCNRDVHHVMRAVHWCNRDVHHCDACRSLVQSRRAPRDACRSLVQSRRSPLFVETNRGVTSGFTSVMTSDGAARDRCNEFRELCTEFGERYTEFGERYTEFGERCTEFGERCTKFRGRCTGFPDRCSDFLDQCLAQPGWCAGELASVRLGDDQVSSQDDTVDAFYHPVPRTSPHGAVERCGGAALGTDRARDPSKRSISKPAPHQGVRCGAGRHITREPSMRFSDPASSSLHLC